MKHRNGITLHRIIPPQCRIKKGFQLEHDDIRITSFYGFRNLRLGLLLALELIHRFRVITVRLAELGYDMTGVDASSEMLDECRRKKGSEGILLLMQDMRHMDLYGTVQAAVCTFDSLNYLSTADDLKSVFASVSLFMEASGIFVFDVNTKYAYENVYGDNCYVCEDGGDMLVWQNFYSKSSRRCRFVLTLFEEKNGSYVRSDEVQTEKYFSGRTIAGALDKCGFDILGIYGSTDMTPVCDDSPKAYYICKKRG